MGRLPAAMYHMEAERVFIEHEHTLAVIADLARYTVVPWQLPMSIMSGAVGPDSQVPNVEARINKLLKGLLKIDFYKLK